MQPTNNINNHPPANLIILNTNYNHNINNNNNNNKIIINNNNNNQHRSGSSTAQACAACKYQRRKCAADCILAPYFPHDRHRQFLNAHRLFGVSNIVKIVRHLDPTAKDHAMRTIIFQSDARAADPVGGCHRIIRDLDLQISLAKAELDILLHHLAICRAARHHHPPDEHAESTMTSSFAHHRRHDDVISNSNNNDDMMMRSLSMDDCNQMRSILDQLSVDEDRYNFIHSNENDNNILTSNVSETFKEEDEARFSYIQEEQQHVDDHGDLKAAATFFTLTNCDI